MDCGCHKNPNHLNQRYKLKHQPPAFVCGTGYKGYRPRWLKFLSHFLTALNVNSVAYALDGELRDLTDPIENDGALELVARSDERALELIRHDCAHVLAEAVQEIWPGTQVTIGPVIENGFYYDFAKDEPFTPDDLPVIEKKMRQIIERNDKFTKEEWSRDEAKKYFADKGEVYKGELIDAIPDDQTLKIYKQGDWLDLCRGPHMRSTKDIGTAFKLMSVAGAYWRGDSIYGTAWADEKQLKQYMFMREEAEKRDHRKLGREMDLFHFQEEGPGVVFWHGKGWKVFQSLVNYMRRRLEGTYEEVNAPQVLDKSLWETSGHWGWYNENMFGVKSAHAMVNEDDEEADQRVFALKPMNCPGHVQIFKHGLRSYREMPVRLAEFGNVHRYEPSGALHGLMRVRGFTQDDAHVFCTEEQMRDECLRINDLILSVYKDFGFEEMSVLLSTRPEKRVGSDKSWDDAEAIMMDVRTWQCGTTQVDFNLPERFGAFYIDNDSNKKQPVMIHRAICGSMERFLGILIENFAGHFPLWLAPQQVVVATITGEVDNYAHEVVAKLKKAGLQAKVDTRNEKINYKVREHSLAKVPVIMVCGMREAEENSVNRMRR